MLVCVFDLYGMVGCCYDLLCCDLFGMQVVVELGSVLGVVDGVLCIIIISMLEYSLLVVQVGLVDEDVLVLWWLYLQVLVVIVLVYIVVLLVLLYVVWCSICSQQVMVEELKIGYVELCFVYQVGCVCIWYVDEDVVLLCWLLLVCEIFGVQIDVLLVVDFFVCVYCDDVVCLQYVFDQVFVGSVVFDQVFCLVLLGGEVCWVGVCGQWVEVVDSEWCMIGVLIDLSE